MCLLSVYWLHCFSLGPIWTVMPKDGGIIHLIIVFLQAFKIVKTKYLKIVFITLSFRANFIDLFSDYLQIF